MSATATPLLEPETPEQWQYCVDGASLGLHLDAARQYGLVTGGPGIDVGRCTELLRRGAERGFRPRPIDIVMADPRIGPQFGF